MNLIVKSVLSRKLPVSFVSLKIRKMCDNKIINIDNVAREIFLQSVNAVKPSTLFNKNNCINLLTLDGRQIIRVCDKHNKLEIDITEKQVHLIGFGKAVLGMAVHVEKILGKRLVSGIISIPIGQQINTPSIITVRNGALNNLPDEKALETAKLIETKLKSLNENDVIIVLISGGGSSLLPLPKQGITLSEKLELINKLVKNGATINELNIVRIAISGIKGGKLTEMAQNANHIISLVISDVIGDPLNIIASGPTIPPMSSDKPLGILKKYNLLSNLPKNIHDAISNSINPPSKIFEKSSIFLIGNNTIAIESAIKKANSYGFNSICLSNIVQGNVELLSDAYYNLVVVIKKLMLNKITENEFKIKISKLKSILNYTENMCEIIIEKIKKTDKGICIISGGEPTVTINGNGIGGRNQELALRFSLISAENQLLRNVLFLSAGTDGIDGPTNAAGAIGNPYLIWKFIKESKKNQNLIELAIKNNDSFNFYKNFLSGTQHIITGHTGTNVMDLHILIIPKGTDFNMEIFKNKL